MQPETWEHLPGTGVKPKPWSNSSSVIQSLTELIESPRSLKILSWGLTVFCTRPLLRVSLGKLPSPLLSLPEQGQQFDSTPFWFCLVIPIAQTSFVRGCLAGNIIYPSLM